MSLSFIELDGVRNVRDLGGIVVCGDRRVAEGLFYRGSALCAITDEDADTLFRSCGITCVVDLRTGWEREAKPNVLPASVEELHIPFYDLEKVGIEYTRCAPGTHPNGRDIACDPIDYYRSLANGRTVDQMRKALDAIFERACRGEAIYEHCTGGKDRAGIMALLILMVLGASRDAILDDYLLTNVDRVADEPRIYERFRGLCDSDEAARAMTKAHRACPENLDAFYEAVSENYGSMDDFLQNQLGFDRARCEDIRACCTVANK